MFFFNTPILTYHRIARGTSPKDLDDYSLPVSQFERDMHYLHTNGYICLPLSELLQKSENRRFFGKKSFSLSFDDGYEDFFTIAYPILRRYGFTATVFLVTEKINKQSKLEMDEGEQSYLNWEQIDVLHQNGISFGSHTCTHPMLPSLTLGAIQYELAVSKETLEENLGTDVHWLAYPYGASTNEIQRMTEVAGYTAAFGVYGGKSGLFNIWRRMCLKNDSLMTFILKLSPLYLYKGFLRENTRLGGVIRKLKHNIDFRETLQ